MSKGAAAEQTREPYPPATASEIAARLWPPPDPVNYCKREAVARLEAFDRAIIKAFDLRETAQPIIFEDLGRLHVRPTRTELLLELELMELQRAARRLSDALDLLKSARMENELRFFDERLRERGSAEAGRA